MASPSPSPLPVVVTKQPDTDWLANLTNGLLGAVLAALLAAAVSYFVARYVIDRTKKADRHVSRELAAYAAAEELTVHVLAAAAVMTRRAGQFYPAALAERQAAYDEWVRLDALKRPALESFLDCGPIDRYGDALECMIQILDRHLPLPSAGDGYDSPDPAATEALTVDERQHLATVVPARRAVLELMHAFRRDGPK